MRILLVESDRAVGRFIKRGLECELHRVDFVVDISDPRFQSQRLAYDLAILDVNPQGEGGLTPLSKIRSKRPSLPVLALTASTSPHDRARVLDHGADDCVSKPFSFIELSSRVRALLRRGDRPNESTLRVADLEVDVVRWEARRAGRSIDLTAREFSLLEYLLRNAGRLVTRAMIFDQVWGFDFDTTTNVVDVYVCYLRRKVDRGFRPELIHTIRGMGYRLAEKE